MKKALKIIGITIVSLLILLLVLPFLFQGKIAEMVKKEANDMLNAKIDFDKVGLSFIRNFPNASVTINDFSIVGVEEFEKDTLASFNRLTATVDIKSLFGDQINVLGVRLVQPRVHAKVLADGKANWDIMKDTTSTESDTDTTEASAFNLHLKSFVIENAYIEYDDQEGNMKAIAENLNFDLSGNMADDETTLKMLLGIDKTSFIMDHVPFLKEAKVDAKINVDADLKNYKFTFSENELNLNAIKLNFEGWLAMLEEGYDMDIKLNTPNIQFKDMLSLIPAIYTNDFADIQTRGKLQLDASAKGVYRDSTMYPAFDVKMNVSDAYFKYPDLPKSVDNININMAVTHPQGDLDLLVIDVPKFHFDMAGNPFDIYAHIATPMSDMQFKFGALGTLNLNLVKEVYPLEEGTDLAGVINANLEAAGRMSYIEQEAYESINAKGELALTNFTYKSPDMLPVLIREAKLSFTPQYVNLSAFDMLMGNNDLQANGRLENFIAYALADGTIKGTLNVTSSSLNVNDFMTDDSEEETATEEDSLSVVEIPKNINFDLNANLKKVTFDKILLENIVGVIKMADGKLTINRAGMSAFGGAMNMDGYYNTADINNPDIDMTLNIKNVAYSEVYKQLDMVKQFAPVFENMAGKFSLDFQFYSKLAQDMSLVYPSVLGEGMLTSNDLTISNVKALDGLATALKNDKFKTINVKDAKIKFAIKDGRINTQPFDLAMGSVKMNVSGSTGLDQTIDYILKVDMPQIEQVQQIKQLQNLQMKANVKVGGTFSQPTFKVDFSDMTNSVKDAAVQEVKTVVNEGLQKAIEEARKQKDALVAAAEKQAATIRTEAANNGQRLIDEAKKQRDKLVSEAKNPLAKVAAQKAGDALVKEAEKKVADLAKGADDQATKLVDAARTQGDKLIQQAEEEGKIN